MAEVKVYNTEGTAVSTLEVNDRVFDASENTALVHQAVVMYLANQRQGTVHTLTRGEVSGGGKKPFRQKGTGRARQGSTRAPQWTGGGTVFGPKQREWRQRMPQKMRQGALRCVLSDKLRQDRIRVLDALALDEPRTRAMVDLFNALSLERKVLVVLDERNDAVLQSLRNIPQVHLVPAAILNTYDVLHADWLLTTAAAVRTIEGRLS
ncbi:MAG TPA: 50S ribosomal protein L4 [Chloroflexota bacterium]|nr:50S ribosomal protein L4 [Chloroflexota bacterium]